MRYSCIECGLKHLAQALILMEEATTNYPLHRWLAVGHMAEASSELKNKYPELALKIRDHRKLYIADWPLYEVPMMELIAELDALLPNARVNPVGGPNGDANV